ncbi:hypothetical protein [Campylobacter cuniculorum]|uniref:hypothetical protein n=1 Tax=Campylobacter cuniculorum TaxID=374106 RepID=UPI0023F41302|nr:hypothetical protein [Campylobacter cuniculorum]
MNVYKKFIILTLLIPLPFIAMLLILLYIYDPYMFYHKPYFREETYMSMRMVGKSIIDYYDFDSFILGTSMTGNTSSKEAEDKLGGKWVNLSMDGSTLSERKVFLNYILKLKKKEIKEIIYSLDSFALNLNVNNDTKKFDFLYNNNENFFNGFRLYLNYKTILCALTYSSKEKCVGKKIEKIEDLPKWVDEFHNRFGFENWLKTYKKSNKKQLIDEILNTRAFFTQENIDISQNQELIQKDLLSFIKDYPQIQFRLIIPTNSRFLYRVERGSRGYYNKNFILFSKYKAVLKWLIEETSKYPNVKIYGFDDLDYADDLRNYKDEAHYNIDMNSMHLDAIKNNTHILTTQNMDRYFELMEQKIRAYNLEPLIQIIKKDSQEN